MAQNVLDDAVGAVKRNWKEFTNRFGEKSDPAPKDYFAHGWKPPAGKRTGSHSSPPEEKPETRKKVARKK